MTTVEINVDDYFSEEEKKQMVADEFKHRIHESMKKEKDLERILSNLSYAIVTDIVDKEADIVLSEFIPGKVTEIIKTLSAYNVFRAPDAWDRPEANGHKLLVAAVNNNRDLIDARVKSLISELSDRDIGTMIADMINDLLTNKVEQS